MGTIVAGVTAFLAGPAVIGAIVDVGFALGAVLIPMNAIRVGLIGLELIFSPMTAVMYGLRLALAALTVTAIASPQSLRPLGEAMKYVGGVALYLYDVIEKVLVPSIESSLAGAFDHLRPYLPSTSSAMNLVGLAVSSLMDKFGKTAAYIASDVVPIFGGALAAAFDWVGPKLHYVGEAFRIEFGIFKAIADWIIGPGVHAIGRVFAAEWELLGKVMHAIEPQVQHAWAAIAEAVAWLAGPGADAVEGGFSEAWAYAGNAVQSIEPYIENAWSTISSAVVWLATEGAQAVEAGFAGAWHYLGAAVTAVVPYVQQFFGIIDSGVSWIMSVAVPAIGQEFATAWRTLVPVLGAVGGYLQTLYTSVLAPVVGWIVNTAVPALVDVAKVAAHVWGSYLGGVAELLKGVWDLGVGLFSWLTPAIDSYSETVRTAAGVVGWAWSTVLQPVIGWVWSAVKPALEWVSDTVGYLIGKVGQLLSWLGEVINISPDAAEAAGKVVPPAIAPPGPGGSGSSGADFGDPAAPPKPPSVVSPPTVVVPPPKFDMGESMKHFDELFKGFGNTVGDKVKGFKLPDFKPLDFKVPDFRLGNIGEGSGVEPLQDRLNGLKHSTQDAVDDHDSAKHGEPVSLRQQRRDFEKTKSDYDRQIHQLIHEGGSTRDVEALRKEKEKTLRAKLPREATDAGTGNDAGGSAAAPRRPDRPNFIINAPSLDNKQVADLVTSQVLAGQSKLVNQAVATGKTIRQRQSVGDGL